MYQLYVSQTTYVSAVFVKLFWWPEGKYLPRCPRLEEHKRANDDVYVGFTGLSWGCERV
jgi:hypothetical protein